MPRLSVDIDLTYLPIEDRETTLKNIDTILDHIRDDLLRNLRNTSVQRIAGGGNNDIEIRATSGAMPHLVVLTPLRMLLHTLEGKEGWKLDHYLPCITPVKPDM